ncbi:retrovirus-related pol polyprotein from transposon TNT 1-94 [Tanacetum coccineum]
MTSKSNNSKLTMNKNGVAERKNRALIEAAKTMLSGSVFSKQYWTEAVATACYTQNRSTIVKRNLKTTYEIFCKRIPNINFIHVFGCLVYIHNHKDHLGKFEEKADDGYLLGYSLVSINNINIAETERYPPDEYLRARMLTSSMAKQLSAASAHECLFVDFLFEEEPKKVSEALKHPGWVNAVTPH